MSFACIYLQHSSKKDRSLAELKTLSCNLESQLGEARERAEIAEKEMGELKMEVQDIEGVLANHQVEMTSLHEQLTEVGCSPVNEVPFHVYFNPLTANAALPNYPSTAEAVNAVTWVKW